VNVAVGAVAPPKTGKSKGILFMNFTASHIASEK